MEYEIETTNEFDKWLSNQEKSVISRIKARIFRVSNGNFGDYKQISDDIFELRFFFGSAYRIYYTFKDDKIVVLLTGGIKSSQSKDIKKTSKLLQELNYD